MTIPLAVAAAGRPSISFVASATTASSATTITIPAGAQAGDLAVLFQNYGGGITTAPGWPYIWGAAENTIQYHTITAGEPGTTVGITTDSACVMFVFRPSKTATFTPNGWNTQNSGTGAPTNQTVTAVGQATPLIVLCMGTANTGGGTYSFSPNSPALSATATSNPNPQFCIAGYTIYNSSPANQSIGQADGGSSNALASGMILVS